MIERGRWKKIVQKEITCLHCQVLEDEYHVVIVYLYINLAHIYLIHFSIIKVVVYIYTPTLFLHLMCSIVNCCLFLFLDLCI